MRNIAKNITIEQYTIAIQRTNGSWNYARVREGGRIEFVPWNEWYRDVVWFNNPMDAYYWWHDNKHCFAPSTYFDKYFKKDSLCIRKRVLTEEIEQGIGW